MSTDVISEARWEAVNSPRNGNVLRAPAKGFDDAQKQQVVESLFRAGISEIATVPSQTSGEYFFQIPQTAAPLLEAVIKPALLQRAQQKENWETLPFPGLTSGIATREGAFTGFELSILSKTFAESGAFTRDINMKADTGSIHFAAFAGQEQNTTERIDNVLSRASEPAPAPNYTASPVKFFNVPNFTQGQT